MILCISKNCDLININPHWVIDSLRKGKYFETVVGKHRIPEQVERDISPRTVDGVVFWTHNPMPFLGSVREYLEMGYASEYFVCNIVGLYNKFALPNINSAHAFGGIRKLAEIVGPEKVFMRYAPLFTTPSATLETHIQNLRGLVRMLKNSVSKCIISAPENLYEAAVDKRISGKTLSASERELFMKRAREICGETGIDISLCGVYPCIDADILAKQANAYQEIGFVNEGDCHCNSYVDIGTPGACTLRCAHCSRRTRSVKSHYKEWIKEFSSERQRSLFEGLT